MIITLQILSGLLLLFIGGEVLVRGAVALAKNFGLSSFVIGLTVVAYGTSSPEMVVSVQAALGGHPDIALGNVVGSNIANILCVMGLTAIVYPVAIDKKMSAFDGFFMLFIAALLCILGIFGTIGMASGAVLLTILVFYTYYTFKNASKNQDNPFNAQTEEIESQVKLRLNSWQAAMACIIGIALLSFGGDVLIKGAVSLARIAGISEVVIGVTLVALGTSLPELATSVIAAFRKHSGIVLGNIIGSNLFNIVGILGVTSVIKPIEVNRNLLVFDMPVMLAVTIVLSAIIYYSPSISRRTGIIFVLGYAGYITAQFL